MANTEVTVQQQQPTAAVVRQEFGAVQTVSAVELAMSAVAAQAKAAVEARYILALKRPRSWDDVRVGLLKECKRPSFAQVARYTKPIGKDQSKWPSGPSVRFAEAALRSMTNCYPETTVIVETDQQRVIQVSVTDLESNLTYSTQVIISKTVERKFLKDGQVALSERTNSQGQKTYLVHATEDEILMKQNAIISKALRTQALRLLPGDILDECMEMVQATARNEAATDPDKHKKALVDAFAAVGIKPLDLAAFLGHSLDTIQPAELVELRAIYTSIKDGDATWDDVMESRGDQGGSRELQDEVAQRKIEELKNQNKGRFAFGKGTPSSGTDSGN